MWSSEAATNCSGVVTPSAFMPAIVRSRISQFTLIPTVIILGERFGTVKHIGKAEEGGVEVEVDVWDDMPHVWHQFAAILPEGQQAIERIGDFMRKHTG
jgi:acetyl esterase/lipase